jgi:hypothetical protein
MMTRARLWALLAVCVAVSLVIVIWVQARTDLRSEVVGDSPSREGWKTIAFEGVQIDVPSAWERLDMNDCEFQFERWARPGSPPCDFEGGAGFYDSSTFDPAHGPGVRRTTENGIPTWGGYVRTGDFAVYASDSDRAVVQAVLDSAHCSGGVKHRD